MIWGGISVGADMVGAGGIALGVVGTIFTKLHASAVNASTAKEIPKVVFMFMVFYSGVRDDANLCDFILH